MAEINDIISRTPVGGTAVLPTGEFEGPVYITRPMRLQGNNTTLWAKRGSVIEITAQGCAIEQLRVELTESSSDNAVVARYPAAVRDVEIAGGVSGFGAEDGSFDVPRAIELGEFPSDGESTFLLTVNVPAATEIKCTTPGLSFSPKKLEPGRNELTITVSGISAQTYLYSEVLFKSLFTRRVYVSGRPSASAEKVSGKVLYTAPERGEPPQSAPPTDVLTVDTTAPPAELPLMEMRKGQRVSLYQYIGSSCAVSFTCEKPAGMEIDPYVFLLDSNEKALGDRALVFFGNNTSVNGEVRYFSEDGRIEIDFDKADHRVQKIAVVFSIYEGGAGRSFAQVRAPRISLSAGGRERISYSMDGLTTETTVVAAELYLYKNEWKISAVGSGYRDGMVRLCAHYGIDATE